MDTVIDIIRQIFHIEIYNLPIYFLHGAALVGFVATTLLFRRINVVPERSIGIGLALGLACLMLSTLTQSEMQQPVKNIPVIDYLFIAGVLGGWRNLTVVFGFVVFSRVLFGGSESLTLALIDYFCISVGSLAANYYLNKNIQKKFHIRYLFMLVLLRFFLAEVSTVILYTEGIIEYQRMIIVFAKRLTTSLTISVFIIVIVVFMLRNRIEEEQAFFIDKITGLPNRRALQKYLEEKYAMDKNIEIPYTMLLIELDNLQNLIERYGYQWSDDFEIKFSKELDEQYTFFFPSELSPMIFEFSENSFAIVLQNITRDQIQADGSAQNFLNALTLSTNKIKYTIQPSFSVSVIDIPFDNDFDPVRFLRTIAMLEKSSYGKVKFYESNIEQKLLIEEILYSKIKTWINEGGVPMGIQPKINLQDGVCIGGEALLRVVEGSASAYISPFEIIRVAEKYRLRLKLEWAIICEVVGYIKSLPDCLSHLRISVNLTPDTFSIPGIGDRIVALLKKNNVNPQQLIIEIIETNKFTDTEIVKLNISSLINSGITLSLDDFGTGYSSISLLSKYNFNELKLDYSMTTNIDDPRMFSAIKLCIDGAEIYGANIIAEGIESKEQMSKLMDMGVQYGQGYFFGKAMPLESFIDFALNNRWGKEYSVVNY